MAERRNNCGKSVLDLGDADRPNDFARTVAGSNQDNRFGRKFSRWPRPTGSEVTANGIGWIAARRSDVSGLGVAGSISAHERDQQAECR